MPSACVIAKPTLPPEFVITKKLSVIIAIYNTQNESNQNPKARLADKNK